MLTVWNGWRSSPLRRIVPATLAAALAACADAGPAQTPANAIGPDPDFPSNFVEPVGQRSPFGNFLAGRFAERERDFARAATALQRALEENPNDLALLRRTFYVTLEAGQLPTALKLARQLDESGLDVPVAQLLLAAESVRRGDYDGARRRLEPIDRSSDLARLSVPLALAWTHFGDGRANAAIAALDALDEAGGLSLLRELHAGFIYDALGRPAAAETAYREALGGDATTAPVRVVRALGGFLERHGKRDEARDLYESYGGGGTDALLFADAIARMDEGRVPEPLVANAVDGLAESFFDIASVLPKERAGEVVLVYVRMALHLRPDFPLAKLLLGEVLDSFRRYADAVEVYRSIDPDGAYGWVARLRMADDLYDLGDVEAAIATLRQMGRERPERSDALVRLGNILRYEERYDEAIVAYDAAVRRLGEVRRENWTLLYSRGISLERAGQWDRAETDLLRALELEPDQPFVLNYLGYSWVEQGKNLHEARRMLERAVAQRQDDGYIVDSMGWALFKLGEFQNAVNYLERAVALRPQDPVINDHLGDAYWRVGRRDEARIQWRRVLGLKPEDRVADEVRRKLERGLPPVGAPQASG